MSAEVEWLQELKVISIDLDSGEKVINNCKVDYAWWPQRCSNCKEFGHKDENCAILIDSKKEKSKAEEDLAKEKGKEAVVDDDGFTLVNRQKNKKFIASSSKVNDLINDNLESSKEEQPKKVQKEVKDQENPKVNVNKGDQTGKENKGNKDNVNNKGKEKIAKDVKDQPGSSNEKKEKEVKKGINQEKGNNKGSGSRGNNGKVWQKKETNKDSKVGKMVEILNQKGEKKGIGEGNKGKGKAVNISNTKRVTRSSNRFDVLNNSEFCGDDSVIEELNHDKVNKNSRKKEDVMEEDDCEEEVYADLPMNDGKDQGTKTKKVNNDA